MPFMRVVSGSREHVCALLADLIEGWFHLGKPERAEGARSALVRIAEGDAVVVAGHTEYRVEGPEAPS